MKKLISFSVFAFIILMTVAAHSAQAGVIVRAGACSPVVVAGVAAYPPYGYRGYRCVRRVHYPMAMGYYPRARFYGRPGIRMRVW